MKCFLIGEQRLNRILAYDVRKSALGVFNWYRDSDGVLNAIITVRGITYIYQQLVQTVDELPMELQFYITKEYEVLGFFEPEDLFDEEIIPEYEYEGE